MSPATVLVSLLGVLLLIFLFIIFTDGRYFGKGIMYWVYDRLAPGMFGAQSEAARWQALAQTLNLRGDERVLDVGTAAGDLPLSLAARFEKLHVTGVDWSPGMIVAAQREAQRRGLSQRAHFQVADLRQGLPFETAAFDAIFCLGLVETLPGPERNLAELARLLAPDGVLVLSLYTGLASRTVAISLERYRQMLAPLGLGDLQTASCRANQDVLGARR